MARSEHTVVQLEEQGSSGEKFIARIENGIVDVQVQTVENYASIRIAAKDLDGLWAFLGRVLQDPVLATLELPEED